MKEICIEFAEWVGINTFDGGYMRHEINYIKNFVIVKVLNLQYLKRFPIGMVNLNLLILLNMLEKKVYIIIGGLIKVFNKNHIGQKVVRRNSIQMNFGMISINITFCVYKKLAILKTKTSYYLET